MQTNENSSPEPTGPGSGRRRPRGTHAQAQAANLSVRVFSEVSTVNGTAAQVANHDGARFAWFLRPSVVPQPFLGRAFRLRPQCPARPRNWWQMDRGKAHHQDRPQFSGTQTGIS